MLDFRWVSIIEDLEWLGEKFTPGMAWVDLQFIAKDNSVESSFRALADRWKWSTNRVIRFIKDLEDKKLVELTRGTAHGTITEQIISIKSTSYKDNGTIAEQSEVKKRQKNGNGTIAEHATSDKSVNYKGDGTITEQSKEPPLDSPSLFPTLPSPPEPPISNTLFNTPPIIPQENIYKAPAREIIDRVYKAYPTKCPVAGRPTGKSSKDKEKIKRLLKLKTEEELISIIKRYVKECTESNVYLKNFSTFLNNLPDYTEEQDDTPLFESDNAVKRSQEIIRRFMEQNEKEQKQFREQNGIQQ